MKKSTLSFILMVLIGIAPMATGIFSTYVDNEMGDTIHEEVAAMASSELASEGVDNIDSYGDDADTIGTSSTQDSIIPAPEERTHITTSANEDVSLLGLLLEFHQTMNGQGQSVAMVGATNTALIGLIGWFYRRRERVEAIFKKLDASIGDLGFIPWSELFPLMLKSLVNYSLFKRLVFRTDKQFSVYGFTHTAMLPTVKGRPIQHLDRLSKSPEWVIEDFIAEIESTQWRLRTKSLNGVVRAWGDPLAIKAKFMQDSDATKHINYVEWLEQDGWRTDGSFSMNPCAVSDELTPAESAIMLFFDEGKEKISVYTLIAFDVEVPETLEQWEDFIMAFCDANAPLVNGKVLMRALAIHTRIND